MSGTSSRQRDLGDLERNVAPARLTTIAPILISFCLRRVSDHDFGKFF
jgi:hypothetical protein